MNYYPENFKKLLAENTSQQYVGQGNPNAKILIIGKELTYPGAVITQNHSQWEENLKNQTQISDIEKYAYNPLFPNKGKTLNITAMKNWDTKTGVTTTWYNYQKFINQLLPADFQCKRGEELNFFKYCFLTELSENCKPMSGNKFDKETAKSVEERLLCENGILRKDFFQQFPIIILACFHYFELYIKDIEKKFDTKFIGKEDVRKGEFISKHISADGKRMLLHTSHFARKSNDFISAVAQTCKEFLNQQNINLL